MTPWMKAPGRFERAFVAVAAWLSAWDGSAGSVKVLRAVARELCLGAALSLLLLAPAYLFFFRVTSGLVGVRQHVLGGAGVVPRDYPPGLHPSVRGFDTWYLLNTSTRVLAFGLSEDFEKGARNQPALELRTQDGNLAEISASVLYRIRPGEAWQLVSAGLSGSFEARMGDLASSVLRSEFAALSSEQLARVASRRAAGAAALERLRSEARALHLEVETVQIAEVRFWKEYEKALSEERLERESARLFQALARLEQEKGGDAESARIDTPEEIDAEEARIKAEADRDMEILRSAALLEIQSLQREAESYAALKKSQADATYERETAAGNLALERTHAERERGMRQALSTADGRVWLAREAASNLKIKRVQLNAADPRVPSLFDVDAIVTLLLGRAPGT